MIEIKTLTKEQKELLEQCGADAQGHPLVLDGKVLRFKANPIVRLIVDMQWVDLNQLSRMVGNMDSPEIRLGIRAFYRDMGYSLCGYLDIFGEILTEEESNHEKR